MPLESFDRPQDISSASSIQWGDLAGVYTMRPEANGRYTVDAGNQLSTSYYSETVSGGNGGVTFETIRGNGPYMSYSSGSWDNRDFYGSRYNIDPYMNRWDPRYGNVDPYMDRWDPRYGNIDMGIYDPRFQDPRFLYDDPRYYDPRYSQQYDPRYSQYYDPRYSQYYDPRYSQQYDPRYSQYYDPRYSQYDPRYSQDPRYYDPRYSQDPRYAYDPRYSYDPRYATDPRYSYDPRYSQDPRYAYDPRYSQQYDPRYSQQYDPRLNNRNTDYRYQWGGNRWDPRVSGDYRYDQYQQQSRPYFDPRQRQLEQMYRPGGNVADFMVNQMQAQIQRRQQENYYRQQQQYQQQQQYRNPQYDYRQQQNDQYRQQQMEQYRRQQQYEAYLRSQQQQQQRYDGYRNQQQYDPRQQQYDRQQQQEAYRRQQYENYMRHRQGQNGYREDAYYDPRRQQQQQYQQGDPAWARLSSTVQGMVGHSTLEYNPNVPENLGCATFVSAALSKAYGVRIRDTGVASLETSMKKNNFQEISLDQVRPGDVLIGHRAPGDYGHAAIYVGNGQIANNNSGKRRISIDSADKFNNPSFRQVKAYRYVGDVRYA